MNPVTYTMLDLKGLDLASVRGQSYPGLYNSIYAAMNRCQEIILCNWFVAGILIPPTYCLLDIDEYNIISINNKVFIYSDDTIEIPGMGTTPNILELTATQNGEYTVPEGVDGYNPVIVNVPPYVPVISPLSITENGVYTVPAGIDGYGPITVEVENNMHDYSNAEQVVGTWVDGKPIYEITLTTTNTTIDVSNLNIETLVYTNAIGADGSNYTGAKWVINSVSGSGGRLLYFNNGQIRREGSFNTFHIILQYTKTTDSVG